MNCIKGSIEYMMDKETNSLYKGMASLKYCNEQIAQELYELSQNNHYESFIDLLTDIKTKTSVNSRQLEILIGLNFFSDFGKNKYLMDVNEIYDKFYSIKQIKKDKMEELGLSEYLMNKYANETPKMYKNIDNLGLISELVKRLENKSLSVVEQVKFEQEYLGYVVYTNPKVNEKYWICTDYKVYKEIRKPYVTLHNVRTGEDVKTKITSVKVYERQPFGLFSVLKVNEFTTQFKKKNVNGEWIVSDTETEEILTDYEVIK